MNLLPGALVWQTRFRGQLLLDDALSFGGLETDAMTSEELRCTEHGLIRISQSKGFGVHLRNCNGRWLVTISESSTGLSSRLVDRLLRVCSRLKNALQGLNEKFAIIRAASHHAVCQLV